MKRALLLLICLIVLGAASVGFLEQPTNAILYGADRTGVADSSVAINAAAAATVNTWFRNIYVPAGLFRANHQIVLSNTQCLVGDGKWNTQILVDTAFDPTAASVISALCVHDIGIVFTQAQSATARANGTTLAQGCNVSSGSTGVCKYPWAITAPTFTSGSPGAFPEVASPMRVNYRHIMISGGWDGIDAKQTGDIDDIYLGTLDVGLQTDGWADFGHVSHIHGWNFGFTTGGTFQNVWSDGTNIGLNINRDDGTVYTDITLFRQRMVFTAISSRATVNGLHLDGTGANLEVNTGSVTAGIRVTGMYFGWGATGTGTGIGCPVMLSGAAALQITNFNGSQNADKEATPLICQTAGELLLTGGSLTMGGTAPTSTITKSGAGSQLSVNGVVFAECGGVCTLASPVIADTGTGVGGFTQVTNNLFGALVGTTNQAFSIATDTQQNLVAGNAMANLLAVLPGGGLGAYDRRYGGNPQLTSCGTGTPSVSTVSNDESGTVTTGTGAPSACTVNFVASWGANAPPCTITPEFAAATATAYISAKSGSAFTVTFSAGLTSGKFDYVCRST